MSGTILPQADLQDACAGIPGHRVTPIQETAMGRAAVRAHRVTRIPEKVMGVSSLAGVHNGRRGILQRSPPCSTGSKGRPCMASRP